MLTRDVQQGSFQFRFVIRPNSSLSWHGNLLFFVIMVIISFGIASVFTAKGYWVVFPFAGLEMAVLGMALMLCSWRASWCEVVSIRDDDTVEVIVGRHKPECRYTFNRHWARVILASPRIKGYPNRLVLRSHGREVEIGACLNNEERQQLAQAIQQALIH
jgi:uncharacterized membrane protein